MLSAFMENILEDEVDAVIDDTLDNEDVELPPEEDDGIFADTPAGVEYDEEDEYEDPYIVYDVDEEEGSEDDEEDEYEDDDEDPFVQESSAIFFHSLNALVINEETYTRAVLNMFNEAETEEAKKAKAIQTVKELEQKLNMYKNKGYEKWTKGDEAAKIKENIKIKAAIDALCTITTGMIFVAAGATLPVTAAGAALTAILGAGSTAMAAGLNKAYSRDYNKQDVAKIKHYISKCKDISKELNDKADSTDDAKKAKNLRRTAKDYEKMADKFSKELEIHKLNVSD